MKKFLSLVLALVMTMSLVTVSAGAKDYADASDIEYVEAVDVLSAIGVLEGDDNGFRPTDTLKRSEAAKIIAALNLTPKTAAALSADTAPFADVPVSHWAAGYIAEGVDSGYIAGVGDNKFNPDGKLIGYAYLKMLLVALGYDASIEGLTGTNWTVNVLKLAKKAKLTDGNDNFVGSAAVTREEAALYALNALQAKTVDYEDKGTNVTINGVEIVSGASTAKYVTDEDDNYVLYKAENFSKLVKEADDDTVDAYGRPSVTWYYKGEEVGTYAESPVLSYTAKTDGDDIKADLKAEGFKKYISGVDKDGENVYATIADSTFEGYAKNGKLVEFYADEFEDENGKVTNAVYAVVEIETKIAQVNEIKSDKKGTSEKDEREIKLSGVTALGLCADDDDVVANFEALYDEVEEDDYLLYTLGKNSDGETIFVTVDIPEIVEGKITKVTTGTSIVLSGTTYKLSKNAGSFAVDKNTQKVWLDNYGYAIRGEKADNSSDVVYLVAVDSSTSYGEITWTAQVVTAEGEIELLTLDDEVYDDKSTFTTAALYTYTLNSDDEATLTPADAADYEALSKAIDNEDERIKGVGYFTDDVLFVYIKNSGSKLKVYVEEGVQDVAASAVKYAVLNDDGDITTVYAIGEPDTATEADELIFVKAGAESNGSAYNDSNKLYNTYKLYFDGESSTEMVKSGMKLDDDSLTVASFYEYSVTSDGVYTLKAYTTYEIKAINKDKYINMAEIVDDDGVMTNVLLDTDAEIYDLSDNGITTLAELADMWDEGEELTAYAAYDADDEVVLCVYIVG